MSKMKMRSLSFLEFIMIKGAGYLMSRNGGSSNKFPLVEASLMKLWHRSLFPSPPLQQATLSVSFDGNVTSLILITTFQLRGTLHTLATVKVGHPLQCKIPASNSPHQHRAEITS